MKKYSMELYVGVFVLFGLLCVSYLTVQLGKMELFGSSGYEIEAKFTAINGLRNGASVEIAGVSVGKVTSITLDDNDYRAKVRIRVREGLQLSEDTGASIKTSGLIGDKYIALSPGGSETMLENNDELYQTQDAIDIEKLISDYVFGSVK